MSDTTRYDLNAKELDALMLFSGPLGNMAKAAIGFLTGFDVLVPVDESLLTREEAANAMMAFLDQHGGDVGRPWPTIEDALEWLEPDDE